MVPPGKPLAAKRSYLCLKLYCIKLGTRLWIFLVFEFYPFASNLARVHCHMFSVVLYVSWPFCGSYGMCGLTFWPYRQCSELPAIRFAAGWSWVSVWSEYSQAVVTANSDDGQVCSDRDDPCRSLRCGRLATSHSLSVNRKQPTGVTRGSRRQRPPSHARGRRESSPSGAFWVFQSAVEQF